MIMIPGSFQHFFHPVPCWFLHHICDSGWFQRSGSAWSCLKRSIFDSRSMILKNLSKARWKRFLAWSPCPRQRLVIADLPTRRLGFKRDQRKLIGLSSSHGRNRRRHWCVILYFVRADRSKREATHISLTPRRLVNLRMERFCSTWWASWSKPGIRWWRRDASHWLCYSSLRGSSHSMVSTKNGQSLPIVFGNHANISSGCHICRFTQRFPSSSIYSCGARSSYVWIVHRNGSGCHAGCAEEACFDVLIRHIYNGECPQSFESAEAAKKVLLLADQYGCETLKLFVESLIGLVSRWRKCC